MTDGLGLLEALTTPGAADTAMGAQGTREL